MGNGADDDQSWNILMIKPADISSTIRSHIDILTSISCYIFTSGTTGTIISSNFTNKIAEIKQVYFHLF